MRTLTCDFPSKLRKLKEKAVNKWVHCGSKERLNDYDLAGWTTVLSVRDKLTHAYRRRPTLVARRGRTFMRLSCET